MELSSAAPQDMNSPAPFLPAEEYKGVYLLNTSHRSSNTESFAKVDLTGNNLVGTSFSHRIFKMIKKDFPFILAVIRERFLDKEGLEKEADFPFDAKELHEWKNSCSSVFKNPIKKNPVKIVEYYTYFKEESYSPRRTFSHLATIDYTKPLKDKVYLIELFLKANKGDPEALVLLGTKYKVGIDDLEKNAKLAMACYRRAAKKEFPAAFGFEGIEEAAFQQAECFRLGMGVDQNNQATFKMYMQGVGKGHTESHQNKIGVAKNLWRALDYHVLAGNSQEALACLHELADAGDPEAQDQLGSLYRNGKGVKKDPEKTFIFYKMSAVQGYPKGLYHFGKCNLFGIGTEKNPKIAVYFFQKSANKGNVHALYRLGLCLFHGTGVPKDLQKAKVCFQSALDKGHPEAQKSLENCIQEEKKALEAVQNVEAGNPYILKRKRD